MCSIKAFSLFHPIPTHMSWLEVDRRLRRDIAITADPSDIPYHMISRSAVKAQGKEEEGRTFVVTVFVFPNNHCACWGLAFQEAAKHLPSNGK